MTASIHYIFILKKPTSRGLSMIFDNLKLLCFLYSQLTMS